MFGRMWQVSASVGALSSVLLLAISAHAADLYTKAPPLPGCAQAVDGLNGKIGGYGGTFNDKTLYEGQGSLAVPLGCQYGFQVDGSGGSFDNNSIFSVGGHLFWRNPNMGLLGLYGSYSRWDQFTGVTANHVGPEAEWYSGRWTIQGVAGVEFGNSASGQIGSNIVTYDIGTRFFDQINFGYYLNDNVKVFLGHRYLGGKNALAIGGEWGLPLGGGAMGSLFVEGRYGEDNATGVWGGIRFYFGQKDKPLIRRHREDDPVDWNPGSVGNPGNSTPAPVPAPKTCCPALTSIELAPGMQLAELLMARPSCCQNVGVNLTPGAQLAENTAAEGEMVVGTSCQCPV
ncbi:MAG TPA: hypothetical protein VNO18_16470 [Xanthobacteraceae bacterium]|nr:hypothetical protein [Xanthobacteraceae bacterium]